MLILFFIVLTLPSTQKKPVSEVPKLIMTSFAL